LLVFEQRELSFHLLSFNDNVRIDEAALPLSTGASSFLFLQGPASPFFSRLATALRHRGHLIWRINFNGGDRAFWTERGAIDYCGDHAAWPAFLIDCLTRCSITDIVMLGDCRPLHKKAISIAKVHGIKTHIFEQGYIRPNYITLEHSGVNGFSSLPRLIEPLLAAAASLNNAPPPAEISAKLPQRALHDVVYSVSTLVMAWRYKHYERHWPYGQISEYVHGGRRLIRRIALAKRRRMAMVKLIRSGRPYYVFPMQVDVDSQITFHSQFAGQCDVIRVIIESFARHAPAAACLVITEHPLETNPADWRRVVAGQAVISGVADRVRYFEGGSPDDLLRGSRGVVVVNSTTGHRALELGAPVIALSPAVFNLAGLTFQHGLDRFWLDAHPAEPALVETYKKVVIARTQVNGGFFSREGIKLAVANAVPRLESNAFHITQTTPAPARRETLAWEFGIASP
jgi:capsular polysaccharide export protein